MEPDILLIRNFIMRRNELVVTTAIYVKSASDFCFSFATDPYGCHPPLLSRSQWLFRIIFFKPVLIQEMVALIHPTVSRSVPEILNLHFVSTCL